MVLLIWSTLLFAVSMVTFAWFGVDETAIEAGRSGNDAGERVEKFGFGRATAWITIGCLSLLTMLVLISFLYFWRVRTFFPCSSMHNLADIAIRADLETLQAIEEAEAMRFLTMVMFPSFGLLRQHDGIYDALRHHSGILPCAIISIIY